MNAVRRKTREARKSRDGMTLIELMLVLALLVAVAAMALPAFEGTMADQRLLKAGDDVRAAWTKAHVRAMETGRTYAFRYQPQAGQYQIEPVYEADDYLELDMDTMQSDPAALGGAGVGGTMGLSQGTAIAEELPEGCVFAGGQTAADARSMALDSQLSMVDPLQGQTVTPILFYPDGTTSTANVILQNQRNGFVMVRLRGMTGVARVSDLMTQETLPQ